MTPARFSWRCSEIPLRRPGPAAASSGDRPSACLPRLESARQVGGTVHAELLQGGGGQARGVALRAEHDDLQVVAGDRQPRRAGGVEAPLQHVALDDHSAGDLALGGALRGRADVHQDGAGPHRLVGLRRAQPRKPGPGLGQHVIDSPRHQSCSASSVRTSASPDGAIS